jgi:hypothetical protein
MAASSFPIASGGLILPPQWPDQQAIWNFGTIAWPEGDEHYEQAFA